MLYIPGTSFQVHCKSSDMSIYSYKTSVNDLNFTIHISNCFGVIFITVFSIYQDVGKFDVTWRVSKNESLVTYQSYKLSSSKK